MLYNVETGLVFDPAFWYEIGIGSMWNDGVTTYVVRDLYKDRIVTEGQSGIRRADDPKAFFGRMRAGCLWPKGPLRDGSGGCWMVVSRDGDMVLACGGMKQRFTNDEAGWRAYCAAGFTDTSFGLKDALRIMLASRTVPLWAVWDGKNAAAGQMLCGGRIKDAADLLGVAWDGPARVDVTCGLRVLEAFL